MADLRAARRIVRDILEFTGNDEDMAVNGLDRRNRERLVRVVARALPRTRILVIRDPDYENEFVVDGDAEIINVDLGSEFNGPKDFDPASGWGQAWLEEWRAEAAKLPAGNVRTALERLCDELEKR